MIAATGFQTLQGGLFFEGGCPVVQQLGTELFGIAVVMTTVFALSYLCLFLLSKALHGITTDYRKEWLASKP